MDIYNIDKNISNPARDNLLPFACINGYVLPIAGTFAIKETATFILCGLFDAVTMPFFSHRVAFNVAFIFISLFITRDSSMQLYI